MNWKCCVEIKLLEIFGIGIVVIGYRLEIYLKDLRFETIGKFWLMVLIIDFFWSWMELEDQ
jgi:hypothetical protein